AGGSRRGGNSLRSCQTWGCLWLPETARGRSDRDKGEGKNMRSTTTFKKPTLESAVPRPYSWDTTREWGEWGLPSWQAESNGGRRMGPGARWDAGASAEVLRNLCPSHRPFGTAC